MQYQKQMRYEFSFGYRIYCIYIGSSVYLDRKEGSSLQFRRGPLSNFWSGPLLEGSSLQFLDLITAKVYRSSTYVYHF